MNRKSIGVAVLLLAILALPLVVRANVQAGGSEFESQIQAMKWRNIGPGRVQLRVSVAILQGRAFLCEAYVKDSDAKDKRECAKLKRRINQIASGQYRYRGTI